MNQQSSKTRRRGQSLLPTWGAVARDVSNTHTCGRWAWQIDDESSPLSASSLGRNWKVRRILLPVGAEIQGELSCHLQNLSKCRSVDSYVYYIYVMADVGIILGWQLSQNMCCVFELLYFPFFFTWARSWTHQTENLKSVTYNQRSQENKCFINLRNFYVMPLKSKVWPTRCWHRRVF